MAENGAMSVVGICERKPTVSMYSTLIPLVRTPETVHIQVEVEQLATNSVKVPPKEPTSTVANNLSFGSSFELSVKALIKLVFPGTRQKYFT